MRSTNFVRPLIAMAVFTIFLLSAALLPTRCAAQSSTSSLPSTVTVSNATDPHANGVYHLCNFQGQSWYVMTIAVYVHQNGAGPIPAFGEKNSTVTYCGEVEGRSANVVNWSEPNVVLAVINV